MQLIISTYVFTIGLALGSFALAVADRTINKKDWVRGRSECDFCHKKLAVIDLIPVASWVLNKGKCRRCHKKLSVLYPLVEIALGAAFVISFLSINKDVINFNYVAQLSLWLAGLVIMAILLLIDSRTFKLPYKFLVPLIVLSACYAAIGIISSSEVMKSVVEVACAVAVGSGIFAVLHAVSRGKWIGDGDVLLGVAIGFYIGKPINTWFAITISCIFGLIYALGYVYKTKKPLHHAKIPFGPFLILGLVVTFLFGQQIIDYYINSILLL